MKLTEKQIKAKQWMLDDMCKHFKVIEENISFVRFGDAVNLTTHTIVTRSETIDKKIYAYKMQYETDIELFSGETVLYVVAVEGFLLSEGR